VATAIKETREISGEFAEELLAEFGSPLYVLCEAAIRDRYRRFDGALRAAGLRAAIAYSIKTNYLTAVCRLLQEEGALGELVSGFEYEVAKKAGFSDERLIFNGPYKRREELERLAGKGRINVESIQEIEALEHIARTRGDIAVGLRVHMQVGDLAWSRFGFRLDDGEADAAIECIGRSPGLRLTGIHAHVGTNIVDLSLLETAYGRLCCKAADLLAAGFPLEYVDLGGGFAAPGARLYGHEDEFVPAIDAYVDTMVRSVCRVFPREPRPLMIIEPGRALISEAGAVVTRVVSKHGDSEGCSIVTDAGINTVPSAQGLSHEIRNLSRPDNPNGPVDVRGPLCMQNDCLSRELLLPEPEPGDILCIYETGAYDFSHSLQFIRLRPAVVILSQDGSPRLVRRAERPADLLALEA
jgi:diaminopimelate decarboxylase